MALINLILGCFSSESTDTKAKLFTISAVVMAINLVHKSKTVLASTLIMSGGMWLSHVLIPKAFCEKTYPFRTYFRFTDVQSFMMYFGECLAQLTHFTHEEIKTHRSYVT